MLTVGQTPRPPAPGAAAPLLASALLVGACGDDEDGEPAAAAGGTSTAEPASSGGGTGVESWCGDKEIVLGIQDGGGLNGWSKESLKQVQLEADKCPAIKERKIVNAGFDVQKAISGCNGLVAQGANAIVTIPEHARLPAAEGLPLHDLAQELHDGQHELRQPAFDVLGIRLDASRQRVVEPAQVARERIEVQGGGQQLVGR